MGDIKLMGLIFVFVEYAKEMWNFFKWVFLFLIIINIAYVLIMYFRKKKPVIDERKKRNEEFDYRRIIGNSRKQKTKAGN